MFDRNGLFIISSQIRKWILMTPQIFGLNSPSKKLVTSVPPAPTVRQSWADLPQTSRIKGHPSHFATQPTIPSEPSMEYEATQRGPFTTGNFQMFRPWSLTLTHMRRMLAGATISKGQSLL